MKVEGHGRAGEIFLFLTPQEQAYRAAGIQLKVGIGHANRPCSTGVGKGDTL